MSILRILISFLFPCKFYMGADVSMIVGTILADWDEERVDNLTDRNAYFKHYRDMDKKNPNRRKGYKVVEGGSEFRETLFTTVNGTFGAYADRGTIRTDPGVPIKEAQYPIRIVAGSINISLLEDAMNMTPYQIHDLAEVKKEEADFSMEETMGASALSDGTTDPLLPAGLQFIIANTANTVGTIDESANAFWAPVRDTTGVTAWNTSNEGLIALDAAVENAKRGMEKIDLIVARPAVVTLLNIMNVLRATVNVDSGARKSDIGVIDVNNYRGAEVISDDNVPAQFLYGVNTRHLRFKILRKGEFKTTKMKQPIGGLFDVMQLYAFCNFTCSARRLQFVMTGIAG